jgi:uncharacterized protein YgiM (DUF1202 family)
MRGNLSRRRPVVTTWMPAAAEEVPETATGLTSISLSCPAAAANVPAVLTVENPADGVLVTVDLLFGATMVDTREVSLVTGQTQYNLIFTLESGDLVLGSSVVATARLAGSSTSITSAAVNVASYQGSVVCVPPGGLPVQPQPTQVPPTQVPTQIPSTQVPPTQVPPTQVPPTGVPTQVPSTQVPTQAPTQVPTTTIGTVVNTGGANLNCRATPNGDIVGKIPAGAKVDVRGATQNGWVPVKCGGQDGWVSAAYLQTSTVPGGSQPTPTPPPTSSGFATVSNTGGDNLRCRTTPESGATITLMGPGTRHSVRGATQNGWVPIVCAGQNGWASAAFLVMDTSGGSQPTPTPAPGGGGTGKYVTVSGTGGAGLRCRTSAPSGMVITVAGDGSRLQTRGAMSGGWYPVLCAGQNGWVSASYVIPDVAAGSGELWFDVNLSSQFMRVFRGNTVIMQTYVSTGKPGFATPTGTFYINRKLVTRTMSGVLGGEYYNVPNVPWVMYFTNVGHAVHGAYWHNQFGRVRSHGCINLPVPFSESLYRITPIGTRLRIHY